MKILAFSDVHGDNRILEKLRIKSKESELLLCAGDISIMENNLQRLVEAINNFNKPCLMIHGNHEDQYRLSMICRPLDNIIFFHKGIHMTPDHTFMGYGGGGFNMTDNEFERVSTQFFSKEMKGKNILMTHAPPFGTELDKIHGENRGNKSIRKFIDKFNIDLSIFGHLHEHSGKSQLISNTLFINPGPEGTILNI